MDWKCNEYENFTDLADEDRISALLLCESLNVNFEYLYDFDKQTGYVDKWVTTDIYVYPSIQDFALEYIHQGLAYEGVYVNGAYCAIPEIDKYINLAVYGNALLNELCADCAQLLPNCKVIVIDCEG